MAKQVKGIRVTITGPAGVGKTHLLRDVIAPALMRAGYSFEAVDDGTMLGYAEDGVPHVDVLATNSAELAEAHVRGVRQ